MAEGKSKTGVVKKRASKREKKDWIAAYIFIAPVTLGLLVFYIWPFIQNIWFSFNEVSKFNVATFCGLANYQKLFHDGEVLKTFGNTLKYGLVDITAGQRLDLNLFICFVVVHSLQFTVKFGDNLIPAVSAVKHAAWSLKKAAHTIEPEHPCDGISGSAAFEIRNVCRAHLKQRRAAACAEIEHILRLFGTVAQADGYHDRQGKR